MATAVAQKTGATAEDDEEWLYGDSGTGNAENAENKEPVAPGTGPSGDLPPPKEKEEGEMSGDEQQQQDKYDDDDSDDDDDVQVTIGDIKAFPINNAGTNLFKPGGTYQKQPVVAAVGQKISTTTPGVKGVDLETEGMVNGVNVYEFSLDSLRDEEKPWRKPGADITDYFNYGFNEDTWRKYCQKQNRLRSENGVPVPRAFASMGMGANTGGNVVRVETAESHVNPSGMSYSSSSTSSTFHARTFAKPPPQQQQQQTTGTIAVLGSTAASRRPADEQMDDVQHIGTVSGGDIKPSLPMPGMPPMGIPPPDYSMPPPGMPPMPPAFPQPVPPPGMPVPPPSMYNPPPAVPPFGYPPHVAPPPDRGGYGDRPPYSYDTAPTHPSYTDTHSKPNWDSRDRERDRDSYRERERWDYKRERSPAGSGYSSEGSDEYRYSRSRDYASRDYDSRDYYSRSRDTDRSADRSRSERDRSRSRERDRKHRDRDRDDKKSKRKIKDEPDDSDYYKSSSSKHKKSKRSKRDKDDESTNPSEDT